MRIDRDTVIDRARADRRRYRRVDLNIEGRLFLPDAQSETPCHIFDLSPGGARISAQIPLSAGLTVILYVGDFGRFEGTVVRLWGGDFGVQFTCSSLKRERIAERLTLYLNRASVDAAALDQPEPRALRSLARYTRDNGEVVECEVTDLSLTGVSLLSTARPPIGEVVVIGQMAGRVARHHDQGIAIEFISPLTGPGGTREPTPSRIKLYGQS
ncbi:MAG: PilZ domain-containing protein [Alphaproteobacteria bacterium]|nr:PilZ domain-containing protein [Alphaproteobacteria bacterium]